ncbi:esterase/lipase family protein [Methylobacterium sp. SyP6R]|uniref:esterase/lipase family protein n=1 Tax=Methylobacterium sp. SyP6R TaxID=2718876 RepID=UPI001F1C3C65|nr:alpha/beta fold hydrolase [Methylobacterium sp. SyP6R]MCF4123878.1 alpha/beta fold hydrolase [Methylobacterium sp. SyP6R]
MKPLILFVHGLGGSAETWGSFYEYVTSDKDLASKVEIDFYNYPTKLTRWVPFFWKSMTLQDIAKGLDTYIRLKHAECTKIILVCHSLGGLIGKRYIVEGLKTKQNRHVREIIFFATPHLGAEIAAAAQIISINHKHLMQLGWNSDAIEFINEDWKSQKCEAIITTTYVVGGQDAVVSRLSSMGLSGAQPEVLPDKNHKTISKPTSITDLNYLIVKRACLRCLNSWGDDLVYFREAIRDRNETAAEALVLNKGRSWIETSEVVAAIDLLNDTRRSFSQNSSVVVFSEYLSKIAHLFIDKSAPSGSFDDFFMERAKKHGMESLVLAERMEFARKRHEIDAAINIFHELRQNLEGDKSKTNQITQYSRGVAQYLIGNLYRAGGRYRLADEIISKAKQSFRPAILNHRIELAHCQYASSVCRSVLGIKEKDDVNLRNSGPEFHRFSDALELLASSHLAWDSSNLSKAIELVESAGLIFYQLGFKEYGKRSETLSSLLNSWRRLEMTGISSDALGVLGDEQKRVNAMLGNKEDILEIKGWIATARPSRVLGLLQFASAYNPDWTQNIGPIRLPQILCGDTDTLAWESTECDTLADADAWLRSKMEVAPNARVPLLAD